MAIAPAVWIFDNIESVTASYLDGPATITILAKPGVPKAGRAALDFVTGGRVRAYRRFIFPEPSGSDFLRFHSRHTSKRKSAIVAIAARTNKTDSIIGGHLAFTSAARFRTYASLSIVVICIPEV